MIYISTVQLPGVDFWLLSKIGSLTVENHAIPRTLLFPYTEIASEGFVAHEWLASIFFHLALNFIGEINMPYLIGACGLLFFLITCKLAFLRSKNIISLGLLGGLVSVAVENFRHTLRPELIALILMAIFLILLENIKSNQKFSSTAFSAVVVIVWTNTHGSFILAPILTAIYTSSIFFDYLTQAKYRTSENLKLIKFFTALTFVHCLCCLLNPYGTDLIRLVLHFGTSTDVNGLIAEWTPTLDKRVLGLRGFWIALMAWLITATALAINFRKTRTLDILIFLFFTILALQSIRFIVYIGLMFAFVFSANIPTYWRTAASKIRIFQAIIVIAGGSLLASMHYGNAAGLYPYSPAGNTKLTSPMVEAIRNPNLSGNVLTSMELGSELVYLAYPRLKPSIDCRIDSYGIDYLKFQNALFHEDALLKEFVQRYDVRYILTDLQRFSFFRTLNSWKEKKWSILYMDNKAVLLQRSDIKE